MNKRVLLIALVIMIVTISGCGYFDEIKKSYEEPTFDEFNDFDFEDLGDSETATGTEPVEDELVSVEPDGEIKDSDKTAKEAEDLVSVEDKEIAVKEGSVEPVPAKEATSALTKAYTEGELVKLQLSATDPDGDKLAYKFTAPLNENGQWQTKVGDEGKYPVTVTVSDGKTEVAQQVLIVVQSANKAPVITNFADVKVKEGDLVSLKPTVADSDNDDVIVKYSGWMTESTKQAGFDDAGVHEVTITANDGTATTTKTIKVTVENQNRAPLLKSFKDLTVKEGQMVSLSPSYADPDGDSLRVTYSEKLNENGEWQTKAGDAGVYTIKVTVSDGELSDAVDAKVIVQSLNKAPSISGVKDVEVSVGGSNNVIGTVSFNPIVSDPEGDKVTVSYSGWMTTNTQTATKADAGTHDVIITASDGKSETSVTVKVIVNRIPEFNLNFG